MTRKLYYENNKQKDFNAEVLSCEFDEKKGLYAVVLDQTAFFPEGGGQYADPGVLGVVTVEDVHERGEEIFHYLKEPLVVGSTVEGHIDYVERFSRMQQHSGEHIVSGIVHGRFGYENVGFHLGEWITTLDFNGPLTPEEIRQIEADANAAVAANIPILITYPTKEELASLQYRSKKELDGQVRIITIPGYDVCACCAPHVDRTGEIGVIKLIDAIRYKGGTRISMLAGSRALTDYNAKETSVKEISHTLSAKPEEVSEAVSRLLAENLRLKEKLTHMQTHYLTGKLAEITPETTDYYLFEDELDKNAARRFVDSGMRILNGVCGIFLGNDEQGYQYTLGSTHINMRDFLKDFHAVCPGKGGGKPEMVQGTVKSTKEEIQMFMNSCS